MRILIIEDYYPLADTVATVLRKEHYIVDVVGDGEEGYEYAMTGIYDLAILDLMLPLITKGVVYLIPIQSLQIELL